MVYQKQRSSVSVQKPHREDLTMQQKLNIAIGDSTSGIKNPKVKKSSNGKIYKPLKIQTIHASKLKDAVYQRDINPSKVKNIINEFRLELMNPLKIGFREDGTYRIIDGQHTYMAVTQLFGEDIEFTCIIVENVSDDWKHLTDEQLEARTFAHQHDNTKKLSVNEKFKAAFIGGERFAVDILHICENNGFELSYKDSSVASLNTLVCTNTLINIYEKDDGALLNDTLDLLRNAYNGSPESLQSQFVKAIALFINKYNDEINFNRSRFIKVLSKKVSSPNQFVSDAKNDADLSKAKFGTKRTIDYCMELNLLELYNKGRTADNRLLLK